MSEIAAISDTLKGAGTAVSASIAAAQVNSTENVTAKKSSDTTANTSSVSDYYTDSVEISSRAKSLATSSLSASAAESGDASADSADAGETSASSVQDTSKSTASTADSTAAAPAKPSGPPPAKPSSASSSSDSSSSETTDLSKYTDYQLQQMVKKGTITQTQYNAEIARRKEKTASSQESEL